MKSRWHSCNDTNSFPQFSLKERKEGTGKEWQTGLFWKILGLVPGTIWRLWRLGSCSGGQTHMSLASGEICLPYPSTPPPWALLPRSRAHTLLSLGSRTAVLRMGVRVGWGLTNSRGDRQRPKANHFCQGREGEEREIPDKNKITQRERQEPKPCQESREFTGMGEDE
jgi:hypothetical protein